MKTHRNDRKENRSPAPPDDRKKPYRTPAWEEEKILEKTALACGKLQRVCLRPVRS